MLIPFLCCYIYLICFIGSPHTNDRGVVRPRTKLYYATYYLCGLYSNLFAPKTNYMLRHWHRTCKVRKMQNVGKYDAWVNGYDLFMD